MNKATREILIAADEKDHWEFPPISSISTSWDEIDRLIPEIEKRMKVELDVDRQIQDASFMTDIGFLDDRYFDRKTGCGALSYIFSFRFSNFGRLFTLTGLVNEEETEFSERALEAKAYIEAQGFIFVSADELEEKYDGKNKPFEDHLTWWTRFFDYL